ncbi:hypothetical protein B9T11_05050 [Wohlfahrtiimonas chitiniclastica]|uniref:LexA family protein n=1 Tax=Wohlfahrtiimonas chitiniclastica TaxID=400946 RepID=UPI000B9974EE|nr:S24 family peptidase [Wohlfahrtiimonas chitiniclastica]OYQ80851.1 hypothetical protein B9T11_05050 [Wohlfahrtiimonas chitiniclastica]
MNNISNTRAINLKKWIDAKYNGIQSAFIEFTDTNQGEISSLLNGKRPFGEKKARSLEKLAGMPDMYLDNNIDTNIDDVSIRGMIPVISWVAAGSWSNIESLPPDETPRWLPCPVGHSKNTYALRVSGISMQNPNGKPSFDDGDIIFVDPERFAENKSFVVVRLDDDITATFKQLIIENGEKYLRPLNPNWPDKIIKVNGNATICGVVIGKWVDM